MDLVFFPFYCVLCALFYFNRLKVLVVDEGGNEPEEEMAGGADEDAQYEDIDPKDISR